MNKYGKKWHVFAAGLTFLMILIAVITVPVPLNAKKALKGKKAADTAPAVKAKSEDIRKTAAGEKKKEDLTGIPTREYSDEDFRPNVEETSYGWLVFKTLLILGMMVAGFYYFFRFVIRRTGMQVMGENVLQVLSMVPVGANKYLQIVDLAGKIIVLGVTENAINYITEITDREEIDRIRLLSSKSPAPSRTGFQDYINKHLGRVVSRVAEVRGKRGRFSIKSGRGADLDYLHMQKNRLKKMNGFDDE